jgi:hypothetical protein
LRVCGDNESEERKQGKVSFHCAGKLPKARGNAMGKFKEATADELD